MRRWAIVSLLLISCSKTDSSELKIDDMDAAMTVVAQEDGSSKVVVVLTNRNKTLDYVNLKGADKIYITAGTSPRQELSKSELLASIDYNATFTGQASPNTSYKVEFVRGAGLKAAANSNCSLPATFAISAPVAATAFSRATNDVPVSVTAGNNNYDLKASGTCINALNRAVTDAADGAFTILKTELVASTDHSADTCDVTLNLATQKQGTLDSNWGGGSIVCSQHRARIISSTP